MGSRWHEVTRPGLNKLVLHVMSDSYSGLDTRVELCFEALPEDGGIRTAAPLIGLP